MMDNLSTSDDVCKDDLSENNDADSNCSDVLATENKNKQSRKKSLNDMLKKLNPRGDDSITTQGLPAFLQKNSISLPLEMTCSNDPELPFAQESSTSAESKPAQDSKSGGSSAVPTQARVSSPKSTAEVYKCYVDTCSSAFSQVSDFKQHINGVHQDVSSIPCCFCYSTYKRENIFDHLALHIKNVMKCIYCQVSQDTREELLKHLSDKHPNQPKKINVCIRILNNVRSKRPNSEQNSEQKPVQKMSPSVDASFPGEALSNSTSEVPKSRKTRKSTKPVKTQVSSATDEIEIQIFDKELPVNCDQCTFSCNSDKILKQHLQDGHVSPSSKASLFSCKQCKTVTDCKDVLSAHLAHHKGSHTLRCYLCPYCTTSSNSMDTIEDHVGEKHPSEVFRFEVLQEKIDYLQNMLTCPICNGGYVWQKPFLSHLESVHQIKDVVEYLLKNYNEKSLPDKAKVPRSYFRNLLPDAPDYDLEQDRLGDLPMDENAQTLDGDEPRVASILEAHLVGGGSQEDGYSGMYAEGLEYSERFPPADLSQYVIKKGTPTTFSCDMCPFECVKTAHFRRHLEVHRRNESLTEGYRCGYCQFMHNRLNCIRFHLGKYHRDEPYKMTRIVDNSIISYGPEDDPTLGRSKAKKPFVTTSTPNSEKEKKPVKFEPSSPTTEDDLQAILQFEKQLPTAMIYQDPIKCPKCDFSNRVRINLLRHLKLHKEERMPNGSSADRSVSGQADRESEKKAEEEEEEEKARRSKTIPNPLLEFLTSTKGSSCDGDFLDDAEEVTFVSRTDLTDEYKYFSIKLPSGNQYQCKECKFVHRYPSKVKRHYYYKHAPAFPFKCGYCSFGAVESGKVKRHCKLVHKHKREMVIKRNVYKKENRSSSAQNAGKGEQKKETSVVKQEVDTEDGVKITHEVITSSEPDSSGDLWLPQFVTMLDDDMQCCKLCGYQQEGTSSLRDHVFYAHLEFYPFSCTHCGFALMDTFRVKKHIDMHHAGMPYVAVKRQIKDDSADQSVGDMVVDEMCSQMSSNFDDSVKKEPDDEDDNESRDRSSARSLLEDGDINAGNMKRQFKCHYCGVISKWNRRDIRLHILHVHLRKKVYTCRHCGFGNSKSKAVVRAHCVKFHPSKNVSVRDELVLFNAIIPIDDSNGIVTMALSNKDGTPIFELPNDEEQDNKTSTNPTPPVKVESKVTRLSSSLNSSVGSPSKSSTSYLKSDKWKCKECTYASNSEIDVKYHLIASHMNLKPYSCPHCHLYMNKVDSVSSHIDRVHPGKHKNVVNTIEEKAAYLQKNMECLFSTTCDDGQTLNEDEDVIDADFARVMEQQTNPRYSSGYFRCLICGYRDPRNDKTKYHIIKNHLNLRQFSCPHCNIYMWGRQQVIIHIEEAHPGKEVFVKRTFQEYDEFLRKSIKRFPYPRSVGPAQSADSGVKITKAIPRIYCNSCSFVTDSELSLAAHKRTHKIFQCFYCEFKHMLAARVQSHCLTRHPYKLVRFKQINSSNFESTKADSSDVCDGHSEESEVEFEKEDDCNDTPKGDKSRDRESGTYVCRHCQVVKFGKSEIIKHLDEVHPGHAPAYTFIKAKTGDSAVKADDLSENGMDDEDLDDEDMEVDGLTGELPIKMNNVQNTKFSNLSSQLCKSRASLYQCRLCTYKSNKMTVMRHHIMSHLRYHPYICPYCDVARSVKSFPIKKHVMAKHPGKEVRSLHCVNEEVEKKIANSYFKLKLSNLTDDSFVEGHENNVEEDMEEEEDDLEEADMDDEESNPPQSPIETAPQNRFKCKFCTYETSFKTDMKHHLMKEINYKPLKCSNCPYAETQRPALSKHYQMKHPGCEVKVKEEINGEKEELVRKMLEETYVKKEPQEAATGTPQSPRPIIHNTRFSASRKSSQSPTASQSQAIPQLKQLDPIPLKSNPKMLKCPECSYTNSSMKLVRGHMIKHGPYRFKCSYCDYHAHYPSRIRKHTKTQHQGLTFKFTKVTDFSRLAPGIKSDGPVHAGSIHSDSSNAVYLDGVPMDLPFKAHSDGWFRCQYCDYKSLDRDNFKVHLVTHKPPRWKCFHCNQRYPVVFRVRRHCLTKHPRLPVKWMDVETGRVYSNSKTLAHQISTSLLMLTSAGPNRRGTARKSAGDDRLPNAEVQTSRSVERPGKVMRFSCHLCDFSEFSNTTSSLLKHLKVEHFWSDKLPSIEILPTGDEGEVWALRRCGFCAFETYNSDTFRCHVLEHTIRPPVQCTFCSYASFSRSVVVTHAREEHDEEVKLLRSLEKQEEPKLDFPEDVEMKDVDNVEEANPDNDRTSVPDKLLYKELQEGYIMSAQNEAERPLQWCGNFEGYVRLVNVVPKGVDLLQHDR